MVRKGILVMLTVSLFLMSPTVDALNCHGGEDKTEAYRTLIKDKFLQPEINPGGMTLLSREFLTQEVKSQSCHSLILENGKAIQRLTDEKTGQTLHEADVITFSPVKLLDNTALNAVSGKQSLLFSYKENAPYIKIWVENKDNTPFQVKILPKGATGPDVLYQDIFTVEPNTSQVIYYFGDPKAAGKVWQVDILSYESRPLNGTLAMKEFTKNTERITHVFDPITGK